MKTSNLVQTLKTETETVKNEYLEKTAVWAAQDFQRILDLSDKYNKGLITNKNDYYAAQKFLYRSGYSVIQKGLEIYKEKQVKAALDHYESAILKLADKIETKGLNLETLQVKSGRFGVNFETCLTDGIKTVRAFTIVASGEIQRPHYRYLIK